MPSTFLIHMVNVFVSSATLRKKISSKEHTQF